MILFHDKRTTIPRLITFCQCRLLAAWLPAYGGSKQISGGYILISKIWPLMGIYSHQVLKGSNSVNIDRAIFYSLFILGLLQWWAKIIENIPPAGASHCSDGYILPSPDPLLIIQSSFRSVLRSPLIKPTDVTCYRSVQHESINCAQGSGIGFVRSAQFSEKLPKSIPTFTNIEILWCFPALKYYYYSNWKSIAIAIICSRCGSQ